MTEIKNCKEEEKIFKIKKENYIRKKYLLYKYVYNNPEDYRSIFSYKKNNIMKHLKGCMYGIIDGSMTAMGISIKWGSNSGIALGVIVQLVAVIISPVIGGFWGGILGLLTSDREVANLMSEYKYTIGSTSVDKNVKINYNITDMCINDDLILDEDESGFIAKTQMQNFTEDDVYLIKIFTIFYELKKKFLNGILGLSDFAFSNYLGGLKWGGGGFLIGGISQLMDMTLVPLYAAFNGFFIGFLSDKNNVLKSARDYRYNVLSGGVPPIHRSQNIR